MWLPVSVKRSQVMVTAMHRRLLTRRSGRTTRLILRTTRAPIMRGTRVTMDAGIIARVAIRIRADKKTPVRQNKGIRKGGRPLREDALQLREHILRVATDLFLEQGYGSTSIESVATRRMCSRNW